MLIDPNVYEKPREFMPERFIDSNGQLKKAEELIPFSLGEFIIGSLTKINY